MPRNFNCCVFNHPTPINCPTVNTNCVNDVINPIQTGIYGFFDNTAVGEVTVGAVIPLNEALTNGLTGAGGGVVLPAGNYSVSYFASGTVPADGTLSVALNLGGTQVPGSESTITQVAGRVSSLSQTIALTVPQTTALTLVNTSTSPVTFDNASLFVTRL